ncbi:hypothetical protein D3C81_461180 [compost metagenome]
MHTGEIDLVQAVADDRHTPFALHLHQPREDTGIARTGNEARTQRQHFQAELLGTEHFLLGQVLGLPIVIVEATRYLVFTDVQTRTAIEVDRRRRQVHQTPYVLFQAALDHVLGHHHVALVEILIAPPVTHRASAMHHGFDTLAQTPGQLGVTQIARDELCATLDQMLDPFGTAAADAHVQALLQGETRKAPANEATRAGDQNSHVRLRLARFQMQLTPAVATRAPAIAVRCAAGGRSVARAIARHCANDASTAAHR